MREEGMSVRGGKRGEWLSGVAWEKALSSRTKMLSIEFVGDKPTKAEASLPNPKRVYVSQNKKCKWWFYMCLLASVSVCGYRNIVLVCFWFCLEMGSQFLWQSGLFEQWEKVSVQPAWMNFFLLHQLRQSPLRIWMLLCGLWSSRRWTIRSQSISMRNTQKGTKSGPGWVRVIIIIIIIIIIVIIIIITTTKNSK